MAVRKKGLRQRQNTRFLHREQRDGDGLGVFWGQRLRALRGSGGIRARIGFLRGRPLLSRPLGRWLRFLGWRATVAEAEQPRFLDILGRSGCRTSESGRRPGCAQDGEFGAHAFKAGLVGALGQFKPQRIGHLHA